MTLLGKLHPATHLWLVPTFINIPKITTRFPSRLRTIRNRVSKKVKVLKKYPITRAHHPSTLKLLSRKKLSTEEICGIVSTVIAQELVGEANSLNATLILFQEIQKFGSF